MMLLHIHICNLGSRLIPAGSVRRREIHWILSSELSLHAKRDRIGQHCQSCRSSLKSENDERLRGFMKEEEHSVMPEDLQKVHKIN